MNDIERPAAELCSCEWKLTESGSQYGHYRVPDPDCSVHGPRVRDAKETPGR